VIVLENEPDLFVSKCGALLGLEGVNRIVFKIIFAAPGMVVHPEHVKKRRLAGAGRPHDGNEIAFVYLQVDIAQDVKEFALRERVKTFEMFKGNHVVGM
jgi:hypothetical protein